MHFRAQVEVGLECERKAGPIEKITVFEVRASEADGLVPHDLPLDVQNNPEGVIAIKFKNAHAAEQCIEVRSSRWVGGGARVALRAVR